METKILIKTPKGQAKGMDKKLRSFILGKRKANSIYINDNDSEIIWEVEGSVKDILKINRNVALFDSIMQQTFNSKTVKKIIKKKMSIEQQEEINDMLLKHTTVEIIKEATAEEIVESNKTFWEKFKEKFKKI